MKINVDAGMMKGIFMNCDRNYYTMEALETLLDFYNEIDENMEFDPIGICCDWAEYGNTPCLTWRDFLDDFSYILEEYERDRNIGMDSIHELDEKEKIDLLCDLLSDYTTVIRLSKSVLIMEY